MWMSVELHYIDGVFLDKSGISLSRGNVGLFTQANVVM